MLKGEMTLDENSLKQLDQSLGIISEPIPDAKVLDEYFKNNGSIKHSKNPD